MSDSDDFARLVSLACHDLRTPLATVHGFAKTLVNGGGLEPPNDRYVEMIDAASAQLAELLDELSLAARIADGRYDPTLRDADTLELAHAAAARLGEERVTVSGTGAAIQTDPASVERGIAALAQSALRHGGFDEVAIEVAGAELRISPVTPASAPVVLGEDLRDLGAAVAARLVARLGGSLAVEGETLVVRLLLDVARLREKDADMWRGSSSIAALGALVLLSAACGNSSLTRPASAETRAALLKLVQPYAAGQPKGVEVHVWSVQVDAADPHFARARVGLTGGRYGSGHGDTAVIVAIEVGGRWSILAGPGSAFQAECSQPTAKIVRDLICSGSFGG